MRNSGARHNLGVALAVARIASSSTAAWATTARGMNDGATRRDPRQRRLGPGRGHAGGTVVVDGNAGNGAAASIRGRDGGRPRRLRGAGGVAMKGGLLLVGGDAATWPAS